MSKTTNNQLSGLVDKWYGLPTRDRVALVLLFCFLFAIFGVFGGWKVHQQATKQQDTFDKKLNEYFWLRSQSGNLKTQASNAENNDDRSLSLKVSQTIEQAGIQNPHVAGSGESVQFSFQHTSQAVVSKVVSNMINEGWNLERLNISLQNDDGSGQSFQVRGTITTDD